MVQKHSIKLQPYIQTDEAVIENGYMIASVESTNFNFCKILFRIGWYNHELANEFKLTIRVSTNENAFSDNWTGIIESMKNTGWLYRR